MKIKTGVQRLLVLAAFCSSWSAINVAGFQLVDVLLMGAFALMCLDVFWTGALPKLPRWVAWGSVAVGLVVLTHTFWPTSANYFYSRFTIVGYFSQQGGFVEEDPITKGVQWLVALAVLPWLVSYATKGRRGLAQILVIAWMLGICVSSIVSVTDFLGVTSINQALMNFPIGSRQGGLTSQPVNVGVGGALAAPIAILVMNHRRWAGAVMLCLLAAGVVLSGSRGGQGVFIVAIAATLVLVRRSTRALSRVPLVAAGAVGVLLAARPDLVNRLDDLLRLLAPQADTYASDNGRHLLAQQALEDFWHRPWDGIGLTVVTAAHSVPLQIIASGGILLALGMVVYFGGAIRAAWELLSRDRDPLAGYLLVSLVSWLCVGLVENQLTDRWLYIPLACVVALRLSRADLDVETPTPVPAAV